MVDNSPEVWIFDEKKSEVFLRKSFYDWTSLFWDIL